MNGKWDVSDADFRQARNAYLDARFQATGYVSVIDSERFTEQWFTTKGEA